MKKLESTTDNEGPLAGLVTPLEWVERKGELHAYPATRISYVVMPWEGNCLPYVFHGTTCKLGTLLGDDSWRSLEDAKTVCESDWLNARSVPAAAGDTNSKTA